MRRVVGLVLLALGVFGIVLGLALRFYAYDKLALVPLNQSSESVSTGEDMTVFRTSRLEQEDGVSVTATRVVRGNPEAAEAKPDGDVMVWDVGVVVEDSDGTVLTSSLDHLCLNRHTNEAVRPCSGEGIEDNSDDNTIDADDAVTHTGLSYKFPFGTEQREYDYFDNSAKAAFPMRYEATETIEGVETYKFVQTIPLTKLDIPEIKLPGDLVDQPDEETVTASRYYENTRTVWVEPYSGIIVKGQEEQKQTLRGPDGAELLTVFAGTLAFNEETVKNSAADASDARSQLRLVRSVGPAVLISVGAVLLLVGLVLAMLGNGRSGRRHAQ
ncbi:MAG TPA: DUF3068 domain-containing protein [Pseudonocardiaceae bacterium]